MQKIILGSLLLLFLGVSSCNLPLAHGFADDFMSEDVTGRVLAAPLTVPVYLLLAGVDITLVNPIIACVHLPDEISRAWNEDAQEPNQAKVITGKVLVAPLYTVYLVGFIAFSEQFEKEENTPVIEVGAEETSEE
jgi:hypothetical protein